MRLTVFRALILGLLIPMLAVPVGELQALAGQPQQQQQQQQQQPPAQQKKPEQPGEYAISIEVPVVSIDVVATTANGDMITGLKKDNFRVLEDGVPQTVTNFSPTEAPITMVLLLEFSRLGYQIFAYNATSWAYGFLDQLQKNDWVALETFDLRPRIEVDFSQNKQEVRQGLSHLI
ncbi:MAG TPA: hypothetical protein VHM88_20835, partial [Candidatus Acidoferrales bacterium]|nr:hypothetical protein [Candidatus Acidoferrales bacterium]